MIMGIIYICYASSVDLDLSHDQAGVSNVLRIYSWKDHVKILAEILDWVLYSKK